jgi:hypothetical protein
VTVRAEYRARTVLAACAVLALTSLHHVYGAIHYATPWRYHAVHVSAVAGVVILGAYWLGRARPGTNAGRAADWVLQGVTWLVPIMLIGGFEGLYNHVLKNALYWGGLPADWMTSLFPPPTYEMPSDLLFEITGILQVLPAAVSALQPLLTLHAFRHLGMVFLVPTVVGSPLPASFAVPAAYGDLLAGLLALAAIVALRARARIALPLTWVFNVIRWTWSTRSTRGSATTCSSAPRTSSPPSSCRRWSSHTS